MNTESGFKYNLLAIILIVLGVTVATTVFRFQTFILVFVLLFAFVITSIFYLIKQVITKKETAYFDPKMGSKVAQSIKTCSTHIDKNTSEIEDIKKDIRDLESHLIPGHEINEHSREESNRLIQGFEKQLELRKSKIAFYETCKRKLETIDYNHQLALELERKQAKLSKLEEGQYEAIAQMESLKTELEFDKSYISTIEKLSLRMLNSNSVSDAEALKLELIQITKELKRL